MDDLTSRIDGQSDWQSARWDWRELIGLDTVKNRLAALMASGRFSPVVMLEGREGLGKRHLALWMAASYFCLETDQQKKGCGVCAPCREVLAGTNADILVIGDHDESIKTDDMDKLQQHLSILSSDGVRVAIIVNADKMTREACNRALKTLEEPPEQGRIVLTCSRPLALPATIRGRCLRWRMVPPPSSILVPWVRTQVPNSPFGEMLHSDQALTEWIEKWGRSPGVIKRELVGDQQVSLKLIENVRTLLFSDNPQKVLGVAADFSRVQKIKLRDLLTSIEWELANQYRGPHLETVMIAKRRRSVLSEVRRLGVIGKVVLNTQLVAESIGLSRWGE